jgi:membrane protease YdiL (CAAX protease family)
MMSTRSALVARNQWLTIARRLSFTDVSNCDLTIFVVLLATWSVVAQVGGLIGLLPVLLMAGASVLLSIGAFRDWYSCPALRALGWTIPDRRFFAIAIIAGMSTAFAVSLIVRAAGMRTVAEPATLAVLVVTVGPIVEESFFRGFLQPCIALIAGTAPAITATALCFAAVHRPVTVLQFSCFAAMGVGYSLLRVRSGSIGGPVVMHATYNLALLLFN